jgi:hypothetical protein
MEARYHGMEGTDANVATVPRVAHKETNSARPAGGINIRSYYPAS